MRMTARRPPPLDPVTLPSNTEAEQAVIGSILVNNETYHRVSGFLRAEHFYEPVHARVYAACGRLIEAGHLADPVTLKAQFDGDPALRDLDGGAYLAQAAHAAESIVHAREYALAVVDLARTRLALEAQEEFAKGAEQGEPGGELIARLRRQLDELEAASSLLRVLLPDEWPSPQPPRLIHGVLGEGWLAVVYGEPSAGKSFFAVDLACSVAAGQDWRGRKVLAGPVVYLAGERVTSVQGRIRAWLLRHGLAQAGVPIGVLPGPVDLLDLEGDAARVAAAIRELERRLGRVARLLVVDTMHAVSPGGEENARDIGRFLFNVRRIVGQSGALATLVVHHAGKDPSRGSRGSNALQAAADLEIEVVEEEEGRRQPIVRKMSDGELPELEPFVIDSVVLERGFGQEPVRAGVHVLTEPASRRDESDSRRDKARAMRAEAKSFGEIAKAIGVPKSTVMRWCRP